MNVKRAAPRGGGVTQPNYREDQMINNGIVVF